MSQLIRVPYQPEYLGTPQAVALLLKACELAGYNIPLVDGWRPYKTQKALYTGFINGWPGFNLASNPDDPNGQNNHLRGEAWDIANRNDRGFMLAAGFTPDAVEWWHFNEPNWRKMPIIKEATDLAVLAVSVIEPIKIKDNDMYAIRLDGTPDSGIIIRGSEAPYSLNDSVFAALNGAFGLTPVVLAKWQYDTVVREQWTAHAVANEYANQSLDAASIAAVADAVRSKYPAPEPKPAD